MTVTSLTNPTVKLLASLRHEKYREQSGLFLIEGARMARDALTAGVVPKLLAHVEGEHPEGLEILKSACLGGGGTVIAVTPEVMGKITQKENPQSVAAAYATPRKKFNQLNPVGSDIFVALDRIRDPGNLGTIIRTIHAVNGAGVLLIGACCDPYAPESVRATTGSIFNVPIYEDTQEAFVALAQRWPGLVVGTAATGSKLYRAASYKAPVLAVMGTEQSGMSAPIENACAEIVRIPMYGSAESLNLSVATSVLLYGIRETLPGH